MTLIHDHDSLVTVLTYHWPTNTSGCVCGWSELGHSYPEHVVEVYEESLRLKQG